MVNIKIKRQSGVVLITAMIMIVAVTAVAVSLMSNSSIDLKITNAAQERAQAESILLGEIQKIIVREGKKAGESNFLLERQQIPGDGVDIHESGDESESKLRNLNNGELALNCPRQYAFTEGMSCNMTEVESTISYGTKNKHTITVVIGIGQEYIAISN